MIFLLEEEGEKVEKNKVVWPEIRAYFQDIPIYILFDTGIKLTCISQAFHDAHYDILKNCPLLPMTNMQATGFTGEKLVKIMKQIWAEISIGKANFFVNFVIIPKLIKKCIIGIDAQKILKTVIDIGNETIGFQDEDNKKLIVN